jgi:hypothetical protein
MTKKLAIPEGTLMRIAATKSVTTMVALYEKTRVDRKTLRAINTGQPVKEKTLQAIADRLRVPLAHLLGPGTLDEVENSSSLTLHDRIYRGGFHFREIKLQQLDAAALRRLAGETDKITWLLKIDQMSESLEATLLKLRESLRGWWDHLNEWPELAEQTDAQDNLVDEISSIKTSADINKSVEQLAAENLKMYGGTYVCWNKERARDFHEDYLLPILRYTSETKMVLNIAPEDKNNSTVRVGTGCEPPQKFIESEIEAGIDSVEVDSRRVWSRDSLRRGDLDDEIPF